MLITRLVTTSLLYAAVFALSACGSSSASTVSAGSSTEQDIERPPAEELVSTNVSEFPRTADAVESAGDFGGYTCTQDCSGHEAGYAWAEEKGIDDPDDCDGNSESFVEGCQAYAEDNRRSSEEID